MWADGTAIYSTYTTMTDGAEKRSFIFEAQGFALDDKKYRIERESWRRRGYGTDYSATVVKTLWEFLNMSFRRTVLEWDA